MVDQLRRLLGPGVIIDVQAAGKAIESEKYANKRAEMWGRMRDAFDAGTQLPNDPELQDELTWPEMAFEQATERLLLEKKDLIRKRTGRSPDKADALALTYASPVHRRTTPPNAASEAVNRQVARTEYDYFG